MEPGLNGHQADLAKLLERGRERLAKATSVPTGPDERGELLAQTAAVIVREFEAERLRAGEEMLAETTEHALIGALSARLSGSADLRALLADATVRDIWCQGWETVWVLRTDGTVDRAAPFAQSEADLIALVRQLIAENGQERRFDRSAPIVDLQLADGSRLNAIGWVSREISVSIRKRRREFVALDDLEASGMFDQGLLEFLTAAVRSRCNIVIGGPTGAGKTTLLRALCALLPVEERLITIEDVFELGLDEDPAHGNTVALKPGAPTSKAGAKSGSTSSTSTACA
ncbi:hypothetical protein GCM10029992_36160 [Glycomyces albus]